MISANYPWMEDLGGGSNRSGHSPEAVLQTSIPTTDGIGTLDAYFIESHGENPALKDTTIIYNHGNFAGIEHYIPRLQFLYDAGYNIFVWDYRGYGKVFLKVRHPERVQKMPNKSAPMWMALRRIPPKSPSTRSP